MEVTAQDGWLRICPNTNFLLVDISLLRRPEADINVCLCLDRSSEDHASPVLHAFFLNFLISACRRGGSICKITVTITETPPIEKQTRFVSRITLELKYYAKFGHRELSLYYHHFHLSLLSVG
jgi:hypothetical protein